VTNHELTDVRARLRLTETRAKMIEDLVQVYAKTGSLKATAEHFGVSEKTLSRAKRDYPKLADRIDAIRSALDAIRG
jgi:AraC-like DNA-binding protein